MAPTILAIDPGNTTGWCLFRHGAEYRGMRNIEKFGQIAKPGVATVKMIVKSVEFRRLSGISIDHAVVEDWRLRPTHRPVESDIATVKLVGMFEYAFDEIGLSCSLQGSEAKAVITEARLKLWGYWLPHKERHARDAIRHALLFDRKGNL